MTWPWQHFKNMIASDESNFCHGCNHDHLKIITTPQGWEVGKLKDIRIQQLADELGQLASWQQGFIFWLAIFPFILKCENKTWQSPAMCFSLHRSASLKGGTCDVCPKLHFCCIYGINTFWELLQPQWPDNKEWHRAEADNFALFYLNIHFHPLIYQFKCWRRKNIIFICC